MIKDNFCCHDWIPLLSWRKRSLSYLKPSDIVYEDNHVIVLNKPSNVLSQGDYSNGVDVVDWLKTYLAEKYNKPGNVYLGLIHRLDKGTSGLLITAKTSKAATRLHDDMFYKKIVKKYLCIVHGHLSGHGTCSGLLERTESGMKVHNHHRTVQGLNAKVVQAKLAYTSLNTFSTVGSSSSSSSRSSAAESRRDYSVVEVILDTGRKHQIRAQLSHLGYPIYGDIKYGGRYANSSDSDQGPDAMGIALHAYTVAFTHPVSKEVLKFQTIVPSHWSIHFHPDVINKINSHIQRQQQQQQLLSMD